MIKKVLRQIATYIIFTLVMYFIGKIIKNEDEVFTTSELLLHYLSLIIIIAPSWFGSLWGIPYFNKKAFMLQPFYLRIIRNGCLALILSLISLYLMHYIRILVFNNPGHEKLLSRYFIIFFVNTTIILFIEYYNFYFRSKKEEIRIEKEKNKVLDLRYKVLKEQINPHFLFNSLNVLASLIYEDQQKANKYTKQLSKLYRYILNNSEKEEVILGEELKFIESYFYILKLRFNSSIQLKVSIDDRFFENYVIPLSLQVLIENAIKHNLFSHEQPLKIAVDVEDGYIVVRNNKQKKSVVEESSGKGLVYLNVLYDRLGQKIEVIDDDDFFLVKLPML
ncbi:hypothetical protein EMN47_13040 [Prolixibacteraceae bacterium JC049]|nr:hypothetical protein [Prolixibacteraceae bacterium JC049]